MNAFVAQPEEQPPLKRTVVGSTPTECTKACSRCRETKSITEYNKKDGDRRQTYCRQCQSHHAKKRYQKNPEAARRRARSRYKQIRGWLNEYKEAHQCKDCGHRFPHYVMDFDHRRGATKVGSVSELVRYGFAIEKLEKEIKKCDLVCANCHRVRTFKRLAGKACRKSPKKYR